MPLELKKEAKEHIIKYKGAWFKVKHVSRSEFNDMVKRATYVEWDAPSNKATPQRFKETDFVALTFERIDRTIVDWGDIEVDGKPFPCTRENKIWMFEHEDYGEIIEHVMEQARMIGKEIEEEEEEIRKNS